MFSFTGTEHVVTTKRMKPITIDKQLNCDREASDSRENKEQMATVVFGTIIAYQGDW